ncbi:hypothetical protein D9542_11205 [Corynebacterium macginleyi]|nr:hypothetical protein D9542_11205 [Corynebacterium macginleyi]
MFIMSQQRKKYTPEYRREAADLVIESERPIAHVAKDIGVAPGLLGRWVKMSANAEGPRMGSARRIFVLRMLVCVVSWQKPRWIMSFCHKRQPSSPHSNARRKVRIDVARARLTTASSVWHAC